MTLRQAAQAVVDAWDRDDLSLGWDGEHDLVDALRAALNEPALDVEALARAMHRLEPGPFWNDAYIDISFGLGWDERGTVHPNARDLAAAIAAAYAEEVERG